MSAGWVETPELFDAAAGQALLALADPYWHLDSADWRSESVVVMHMRHFPHGSPSYEVCVDCRQHTARVDGTEPGPLRELGAALERAHSATDPR
jgi:hypothetical protein